MGKRFTDTHLHRKVWFRKLELRLREAWRILIAECDQIGIWEIDMEALNLWVGVPVTIEDLSHAFDVQMVEEDKLWIPGFVAYQYGDEEGCLTHTNKLTPKIVRMLRARGLPLPKFKDDPKVIHKDPPSMGDPLGVKEEDKDKVIEKVEVKTGAPDLNAWFFKAAKVRQALKKFNPPWLGSRHEAEVIEFLGEDLYRVVVKAGVSELRSLPADAYVMKATADRLKAASALLAQEKEGA